MDWTLHGGYVCLVGPGDSGKSTILDAISLVLSPRWYVSLSDADFYLADPSNALLIEATVSDLSAATIDAFVTDLRGWDGLAVVDEPFAEAGDLEPAITVRFSSDESLEPSWHVVSERTPEGRPCSSRERERLGLVRLDDDSNRHLNLARGSALARLFTGDGDISRVLADAARSARSAVDESDFDDVAEHLEAVSNRAAEFGMGHREGLRVAFDTSVQGLHASGLSLHEGSVPLARTGLGSRRLATTAIHSLSVPHGAVVLIDEIEHGLEPHRVKHLVRSMRDSVASSSEDASDAATAGQVVMSTHSPVVVQELDASEIQVSRWARDGSLELISVPDNLQGVLRRHPGAVLSRAVVVCEGKTELGITRGLEKFNTDRYLHGAPPAHRGIEYIDGGGSSAPRYAAELRSLGFDVLLFADGDRPIQPNVGDLGRAGVAVWLWPDGMCTEERLVADLPWDGVLKLIEIAQEYRGAADVASAVSRALEADVHLPEDAAGWLSQAEEGELRSAISQCAKENVSTSGSKSGGWFKMVEPGEQIGALIGQWFDHLADPTRWFVEALSGWMNGHHS